MKYVFKAVLTASALLAGPLSLTTPPAFAQATTAADSDMAPSAQKAEALKNQSFQTHNPTEQNRTFRNQTNEQPDPKAPDAPAAIAAPTGQTSEQMPISSPQHEQATKHKHHKKHTGTTDKSTQR